MSKKITQRIAQPAPELQDVKPEATVELKTEPAEYAGAEPLAEVPVDDVVAEPVEAVAPAPRLGQPLANLLRGAVNDMHHYGVISESEAISIKARIDEKQ